eukprot:5318228-Alexandrium_andersonii.AAC.1
MLPMHWTCRNAHESGEAGPNRRQPPRGVAGDSRRKERLTRGPEGVPTRAPHGGTVAAKHSSRDGKRSAAVRSQAATTGATAS